jgi:RimJ/RimL family protein N-acetyltransferase
MGSFEIRPMRPDDKSAMVDIASRIWDGTDYLPFVFDDWLADADGEFAAATLGGRVVGCGKLSFPAPGHAWLEGLRKDPAVAAGGLAEAVTRYFLRRLAGRPGLASVRFSTYVFNERSIAVNERLGFERRYVFSCKAWARGRAEAEATACPEAGRAVAVDDTAEAIRFVEAGSWLVDSGGLVCEGWKAFPFSAAWFAARYVASGRCLGVRLGLGDGALTGLAAFAHDTRYPKTYVKLAFLDARDRQTAEVLVDAVVRYVKEHVRVENEIELILPPGSRVAPWIAGRGFASWEQEDDFFVYELPLARLADFSAETKGDGR